MALHQPVLHRLECRDGMAEDVTLFNVIESKGHRGLRRTGAFSRNRYPPPMPQLSRLTTQSARRAQIGWPPEATERDTPIC